MSGCSITNFVVTWFVCLYVRPPEFEPWKCLTFRFSNFKFLSHSMQMITRSDKTTIVVATFYFSVCLNFFLLLQYPISISFFLWLQFVAVRYAPFQLNSCRSACLLRNMQEHGFFSQAHIIPHLTTEPQHDLLIIIMCKCQAKIFKSSQVHPRQIESTCSAVSSPLTLWLDLYFRLPRHTTCSAGSCFCCCTTFTKNYTF